MCTGKAYATSLLLCNKHIDKYPREHLIGAIDSAATDYFMPDMYTGDAYQPTHKGIKVYCANGTQMQATATDMLAIPQLPIAAHGCHKFKDITSH